MNIKTKAADYEKQCVKFLRDMIKIPSESSKEKEVVIRILDEMKAVGFEEVYADEYGNAIGRMGNGPIKLVFDGHVDTVGIGNKANWSFDPYEGKIEDGYIYGRGACDNKMATAVQVYGAKLCKDLYPEILEQVSIYVVGSVQEEDCDGLGLKFALEQSIKNVDYVCIGESTNLDIYRGHRGRMEIMVHATGRSCHGSAPERGTNAIYLMTKIIQEIEQLNENLQHDKFLGKGTCAVTHISCQTPSLCAVPDGCSIHIDRRLTHGEDKDLAVAQIIQLPSYDEKVMRVEILQYDEPSYKGKILTTEKYYPTWVLPEEHPFVQAGVQAAEESLGRKPKISRWVFSTNGVSSMGELGIPSIGFGPAIEEDAHTTNDRVKIEDLVSSMVFYGVLPGFVAKVKK